MFESDISLFYANAYKDWVVWTAFLIGCTLLFLTVMLFALVFFLRLSIIKKQSRQQAFIHAWAPIWHECFNNELPENIPTLQEADVNTFLVQWIQYQETYEDSMREILSLVGLKAGLETHLKSILKRNNTKEKILAITALGFLKDKTYWEILFNYALSANTFISMAAARAMLHMDAKKAMPLILDRIKEREDWPQARVSLFLAEAGIDVISQPLAEAARHASQKAAPRLIRYLEVASYSIAVQTLDDLLSLAFDHSVILACLQTMAKFTPTDTLENVRRFLFHPDWEIRAAAIKVLGRVGDPEDEPNLIKLLDDSQGVVQYEAAQALFRIPHFTSEHCLRLQNYLVGENASMVLTRVMTEKQLRP